MFNPARRRPLLYAIAISCLTSATAPAQHVHGVIELGVVVEGGTVAVSLSAPLSDVVGFEHAPESDEQLELIRQAAAILANADAMFGLAGSANCTISDTSIDGPAYVIQHLEDADAGAAGSDDDHHDTHDSHGSESDDDEHADEHEESAAHDHDDSEQHAEVNANYEWVCGNASNLDTLMLRFTEAFAGVETIEIQVLTSAGAHVITAEGRASSVSLSPP
ncbi:MAG: DUF2796 domain-containing protein [Gammaproteobacteria bacterium]|nr:DUF2796 domain-containing protein [Gammaproteobacteria bacterium]